VTTILLTCGETSGEQHASRLVREIRRRDPGCRVLALGGAELEAAGAEILFPLETYAVMGFGEVLAKLPSFLALERSLARRLGGGGIDLFVPVDYPGLNLRLARAARRSGVPVLYYISPQIWAWGGWRIRGMRRSVDLMAVILPFEEELYRRAGIPAVFAGHPMLEEIVSPGAPKTAPARPDAPFTVTLFPGSRIQEFRRIYPVLVDAARILHERFPGARFLTGLAPMIPESAAPVEAGMRGYFGVARDGVEALARSALALAVSGTVTLQTAISGTPMVVCYRTSPLNYRLGRLLVRVPHIAMPNVLAGRALVPELIQGEATPRRIADAAARLLGDPEEYRRVSAGLLDLRERLGGDGGVGRIADIALRMAGGESGTDAVRATAGGGRGAT
jgi:lipid-A-disaccharide synthase